MGWFSSAIKGITGGDIVNAGVGLAGAGIEAFSNKRAADTVAEGNAAAAEIGRQAGKDARRAYDKNAKRAIRDIDRGVAKYTGYVRPQLASSQPGMLNPEQASTREDLLGEASRSLSGAGLRGAGRAGVAIINDLDRDIQNDAYTTNLRRNDRARELLGGINADRGLQVANIRTGVGSNAANTIQSAGQTAAGLRANTGQTVGSSEAATGQLASGTLGRLASIIAGENKERTRDAYADGKTVAKV